MNLRCLLAIADRGSFTGAAEAVGLTQSAVSRNIATLERHLGHALVARRPDGAALTAIGTRVVEHGRRAVEHIRAIEDLREQPVPAAIRVGAVHSAALHLVPEAVHQFRTLHPDAEVLIARGDDDELLSWLDDRTIHVAVTTRPTTPDRTSSSAADEFLAVLPRTHPLARATEVRLNELVAAGVADPGGTCGPLLEEAYAEHGERWVPAHTVRDLETMFAMVAAGITVGVAPAVAVPHDMPTSVVTRSLEPRISRQLFVSTGPTHPLGPSLTSALIAVLHRRS